MWHEAFGLTKPPFRNRPGEQPLFPAARSHDLQRLLNTARERDGWGVIEAPPGLGKTLMLHHAAATLAESFQVAWLGQTQIPDLAALHQALLFDWEMDFRGRKEQELRLAVVEKLVGQGNGQEAALVVIDDAHHLTASQLEELRLLGNVESAAGRCLIVLMAGNWQLRAKLRLPELASLAQSCPTRIELQPYTHEEALEYLRSQICWAGGDPQSILDDEAAELLALGGGGVPRLLNQLASAAFRLTVAAEQSVVDVEAVLAAAEEMGIDLGLADGEASAAEVDYANELRLRRKTA